MRPSLLHRSLIILLIAALLPAVTATPVNALTCPPPSPQDVVWNGLGDGAQLTDGANWEGGVVPTSTQTACISDRFATDTLEKSGSGTFAVMALQSSASILVTGGTLHLGDDSVVEGEVLVNGGHVRIDVSLLLGGNGEQTMRLLNGGRLSGTGTLNGHLLNFSGIISPGTPDDPIDVLTLAQEFIQASDGRLDIEIAEVDGLLSDRIVMSGEVTPQMEGVVRVSRTGSLPALGDTFVIVDTNLDVIEALDVVDATTGDGRSFSVSTEVDPFDGSEDVILTTIEEPPPPLEVNLSDIQVQEGDDGTTDVDLTATLNRPAGVDVDVTVEITEVNTTQGSDFSRAPAFQQVQATIKIPAGDTAASVAIEIIGDGTPEPDETIEASILTVSPSTVQVGQDTATITIQDDDTPLPLDDPSLAPTSFPDTCLVDTEGPGLTKDDPLSISQIALQTVECATPADVDTVLIGRDDDFADSLSSGFLQQDAPLLLVPGGGPIPPDVIDTLRRLNPSQIIIMGGESAISPAVEQELVDLGIAVVRRDGPTRIETAIDVAFTDAPDATTAIIARAFPGEDPTQGFADAIAAGGMAADLGFPVLLTDTTALSANTAAYLRDSSITDVLIMGGTAAVSALTQSQIAAIIPGTITRVAGDSRFGTSVEVAKQRGSQSAADVAQLIMVEGQGGFAWAGGLTAAYQSAQDDAPIVLLNGGEVPPETAAYLTPNAGFAVDTVDVDAGALTCTGISGGCLGARRLLGLNGTTVTFDPPTLSPAVPGGQIAVSFSDQLPASAEVVYGGSCLVRPTTDAQAITIRDDGQPLPCLVTVTITYDSGVVQTSVAAYE